MTQHIDARITDSGEHPRRHRGARHPEFGVHGRGHDVEFREQTRLLIERSVVENVHLNATQELKALSQSLIDAIHDGQLLPQTIGRQATRNLEPR